MFITSVASLHVQTQYFPSKASHIHCVQFRVCRILCRTFMSLPSTFEEPQRWTLPAQVVMKIMTLSATESRGMTLNVIDGFVGE